MHKQNRPQGCSLFCSKGVLGLEINEVIRGITTIKLYPIQRKIASVNVKKIKKSDEVVNKM